MEDNATLIWSKCLETIETEVNEQQMNTWFKPIRAHKFEDKKLTIVVPNSFFIEWIDNKFGNIIKKALQLEVGDDVGFSYVVDKSIQAMHDDKTDHVYESKIEINTQPKNRIHSRLKQNYTFDNFITGENNKLARAAGDGIAKNPGTTSFNPLVIYGDAGLGKTHLIQAIGNEVLKNYSDKSVYYISSEEFTNDFIDSLRNQNTNNFLKFYRSIDVLIVDDIQFLEGKDATQEFFFHTFNSLHQQNKQIILSSDRPPKDLKGLPERLTSRFQWGLTVDIQPPDYETRIAILKMKSDNMNLEISIEIIEYIASTITTNIRELEGSLIRLLAESSLSGKEIDLELAKETIRKVSNTKSKRGITIDHIQKIVCDYYSISENLMTAKTRKQEAADARQIAMYISKELTTLPLKSIGLQFGGRDHTTVMYAHKIISDLIATDEKFKFEIIDLKKKIESSF